LDFKRINAKELSELAAAISPVMQEIIQSGPHTAISRKKSAFKNKNKADFFI
jgi:hypothetical protein